MNIIYIGSSSLLSKLPLIALLKTKHIISAIALNETRHSDINVTTQDSLQLLALDNNIPVIHLNTITEEVILKLKAFKPDIIIVSCYGKRLHQSILSIPEKGCINIHPSLLPKFRGPDPLFWQYREGVSDFGVTLHRMTQDFDAGNILQQMKVWVPDGLNINEVNNIIAQSASELLINVLVQLENNLVEEIQQKHDLASYQTFPVIADYSVSPKWSVKRIYNFINAFKGPGIYFTCEINEKKYKLINASSYQGHPYCNMENKKVWTDDDKITIKCEDGYILCEFLI